MSISAEEVADRNAVRPGLRLVTYREVALPFWKLALRCRFLARRPVPALDEFVLRSVQAELRDSSEVSDFLGIPLRVVEEVMANLVRAGHMFPRDGDSGGVRYGVSTSGRQLLSEMELILPEERPLNLAFDGISRSFAVVEPEMQWRPRDLKGGAILEIPAFPSDPPEVSPADTAAVSLIMEDLPSLSDLTLLSVIGLDGKREKFFVKAVALVYESIDAADEIFVKFFIDGRASEEHDVAFARAEGKRKLGILGSLSSDRLAVEKVIGPDLIAVRADEAEVAAIRRATGQAAAKLASVQARASSADYSAGVSVDEVEAAAADLDQAEEALDQLAVRVLEVHEHPDLLRSALHDADQRLLIVSPWIRAAVVDKEFMAKLESLLDRGVNVSIAYGMGSDNSARAEDRDVEKRLAKLSKTRANFQFKKLGDTHAKVLIKDDRLAVVTSFNWLSFKGDSGRPFRDERGTLITVESEVARLYESYMSRVHENEDG